MRDLNHPRHRYSIATLIPARPSVEPAPVNPAPGGRAGSTTVKYTGENTMPGSTSTTAVELLEHVGATQPLATSISHQLLKVIYQTVEQ